MELTIKDRLVLLVVLPHEGDFKTLKYLRKFRESVALSEAEQKEAEIKDKEGGGITWNPAKIKEMVKEIKVPGPIHNLIIEKLKSLNDSKKLTDDHFELYEKFIGGEDEE